MAAACGHSSPVCHNHYHSILASLTPYLQKGLTWMHFQVITREPDILMAGLRPPGKRGPGTEEALAVFKLSVMLLLLLLYCHHYSYPCSYCNRKEPQGARSCPRKEKIELEFSGPDCRISFLLYTLELADLTAIYSAYLVSQTLSMCVFSQSEWICTRALSVTRCIILGIKK